MHGVSDCARSIPYSPSVAWDDVAFSSEKWIGTSERPVSQLNTQPMVSPVNASRQPSRTAAHHSGPGRLARPYPVEDFHLLSFASLSWRSRLMATPRPSGRAQSRSGIASGSEVAGTPGERLNLARLRHSGFDLKNAMNRNPELPVLLSRACERPARHSGTSKPSLGD